MRHQLPYRDQVLAVRPELGPILRHEIFQAELALLQKPHHSRRGRDNSVSEAISKTVVTVIDSFLGTSARYPKAVR